MNIFQSSDFEECLKKLTKAKFSGTYGTIVNEVNSFFNDFPAFEQIWSKSYNLFEQGDIRVNKVRLENPLQNSGKSGGYRMIIICDRRVESVCLLFIYPKTGSHGMLSINTDFSKKLVKNYAKQHKDNSLKRFKLIKIKNKVLEAKTVEAIANKK